MSNERKVDPAEVRDHIDSILGSYEQVFEKFFLSKFMGLNFDYLPHEAADADKDHLRVTFEVNEMLMNPQGSLHGGIIAAVMGYLDGGIFWAKQLAWASPLK